MIDVSILQLLLLAITGWLDRREREAMATSFRRIGSCGCKLVGDACD